MAIQRPLSATERVTLALLLLWTVFTTTFIFLRLHETSSNALLSRSMQDRKHSSTSSILQFLRTRRATDPFVRQFTNSDAVPWILDYYEAGHDQLDASNVCPDRGQYLRVLIIVQSAANHTKERESVRMTWGSQAKRRNVGLGFLVGLSRDSRVQRDVELEANSYGDVIRGHFFDTYDNLTLKSLSMLEWVYECCPDALFLLKTDDDMFINVDNLLAFTEQHLNATRTIFGRKVYQWSPHRDKASKWYVPQDTYLPEVYPNYTTGPSYLLTADVVRDLFEAALQVEFFKVEDVFFTGILAEMLNVTRVNVKGFLNDQTPAVVKLNHCALSKEISFHHIGIKDKFNLWWKLFGMDRKC